MSIQLAQEKEIIRLLVENQKLKDARDLDHRESLRLNREHQQERMETQRHHASNASGYLIKIAHISRGKQIAEKALADAISTYTGEDKIVTAERIEAWQAALAESQRRI